jgi:glycosyltransferase involved in cell wall biosynthesis
MIEGYIPKAQRKKILLLSDDLRLHSGVATMSREIVLQTCHYFNWVQLGAAIEHPDKQKIIDISEDLSKNANIPDASGVIYPTNGYGNAEVVRLLLEREKPDALMFFTDPRYWGFLFGMEAEIRKKIPMIYLNIWDDLPAPLYNKPYYESCDALFAISKQTLNINKLVLGDKADSKVIKYVPHGINSKMFHPIEEGTPEHKTLQEFKNKLFKGKSYEYVILFNSRNIRRKSASDLIAAYRVFCERVGEETSKKCLLLLHTDPVDQHGTDLFAVRELLIDPTYMNVEFTAEKYLPQDMKYLYNSVDVVCLPSSNEGWGLSLTEGMMCGKVIIGTVTGGIQDQMRFEYENGTWIDFDKNFCSNHQGTHLRHGEWAVPVYPSNLSLMGSLPTPYIFDDRIDFRDLAITLQAVHDWGPEARKQRGKKGRKWAISEEARMSGELMGKNIIEGIEETFKVWKPRKNHELIEAGILPPRKLVHELVY